MKVAVVTGSRADYGLLRPTLAALRDEPGFEPCLLVSAMHLDPLYGDTLAEIEADGYAIAARVPTGARVDQGADFARNIGHATIAFSEALAACAADVLLVLGDRFESFAAALAATGLSLPIVHMHGGELSEGSLDDAMRHCITKLSHLHLVATPAYAQRVCQLGEHPARVHVVGAAGPESIARLALLDRGALARSLGLDDLPAPLLALTVHPESLDPANAAGLTQAVTGAVDDVLADRGCIVVTLPNDDPGQASVREGLTSWASTRPNVHVFASLGQLRYLSLLSHADVALGNSSSAIIEAPSFRLPAVNVGRRQRGRLMAENVLNCRAQRPAVAAALRGALDPAFRSSLEDLANPYDRGCVSQRVVEALAGATLADLIPKRFFDLPDGRWRAQLELAGASVRRPRISVTARLVLAGAGGHAHSILDALATSGADLEPVACTDPDPAMRGATIGGVPVVGDDGVLADLLAGGIGAACVAVGGVRDNRPRATLHARLATLGFDLPIIAHGSACVASSATVGAASVVLGGAVVGAGAIVGENVIVGSGAVVEHDCRIGDHAHLASGCVLGGDVAVATGAHVGLGATILQGRSVGAWAVVGAGAVVIGDVPAGEIVVGCPASRRGAGG